MCRTISSWPLAEAFHEAFARAFPDEPAPEIGPALEECLRRLFERARQACPETSLSGPDLARVLAPRLRAAHGAADLEKLNAEAIYLSAACLAGDTAALSTLFTQLFRSLRARLVRRNLPSDVVDDVLSKLRERLIYPSGERPPLLSLYGGRGSLEGWLARTAYRDVLKVVSRQQEMPIDVAASAQWVAAGDPEISLVLQLYAAEFRDALTAALERLGRRERRLLYQVLIEGRSSAELAQRRRVHRVTINRWLSEIRREVLASVESAISARLQLSKTEVRRLALLVGPDLDLSINRILSDDDD